MRMPTARRTLAHGTARPHRLFPSASSAFLPRFLALALLLALLPPAAVSVRAAGTVTTCASSGAGSLPVVLAAAAANDTLTFTLDCPDVAPITLTSTLIPAHNVTLDAVGHTITISGGGSVQLFSVNTGITLALKGLTLTNGSSVTHASSGAIYNNGTVNVTGSAFTNNDGTIDNNLGTVNAVNTTFFHNRSTIGSGGAIFNASTGTLNIVGSTFSGNDAHGNGSNGVGGAIDNPSGTLRLTLSVVAGNTASSTGADIFGAVTDGGGNVVGSTSSATGLVAASDKLNMPALLTPLSRNGGTVPTFALASGSPALDIAACTYTDYTSGSGVTATLTTDARGITRPQTITAAKCDAGSYEALPSPQAFVVTRVADDAADANCNAVALGGCTLRQAVNASNLTLGSSANTITFAPATFGTAQTIALSSANLFGKLALTSALTITGPGAALLTLDGGCTDCGAGKANTSRTGVGVFRVVAPIAFALSGVTITNSEGAVDNGDYGAGAVTITNCTFTNNYDAIFNGDPTFFTLDATMTITGSTFTGNFGDSNERGGAISNFLGTLTVTGSTFTGNQAASDGGAIDNYEGILTVTGSAFTGNTAVGGGGAIFNYLNFLTVTGDTFTGNQAADGSALYNNSGRMTVVNSTIAGNAIVGGNDVDGAIDNEGMSTITVIAGSTITGNTGGTSGVIASHGASVTLTDTISAGNLAMSAGINPDLYSDTASTAFTGTNNIIGVGDGTNYTGLTNGTNGNRVGTAAMPLNPLLGPLANNGGPVQTRALLAGSPAIDTGTCAYTDAFGAAKTLTTDARGVGRPMGNACDIGAFEGQAPNPQPATHTPASTPHAPTPTPLPQPSPMHTPGPVRGASTPTPLPQPTRHS